MVLVARRLEVLQALADDLATTHGVPTRVVAADLATTHGVDRVIEETRDLDVSLLVAAAGFGSNAPFLEVDIERDLEMIAVNCTAVVALCHQVGRRLAARGDGTIVLFSSVVAFQGVPRQATYAATKAFVQSFGEALALELRPSQVRVVISAPGPAATGFGAVAGMNADIGADPDSVARATLARLNRSGTVRPGPRSKLMGWSLLMLPRTLRSRLLARVIASLAQPEAAHL